MAGHEELGHPRLDARRAPRGALDKLTALAEPALPTGGVVVNEDAVPYPHIRHIAADLYNFTDRLVTEYQRRLFADVPGHDIARANPTGTSPNQRVPWPNYRDRFFLDADIEEIVQARNPHPVRE
jgi:hypothetical protein